MNKEVFSGKGIALTTEQSGSLKESIIAVAKALIEAESELTALDAKVGDGDCGEGFQRGGKAILADVENYPLTQPVDVLRCIADTVRNSMGGSSGAFYDLALRAASNKLEGSQNYSAQDLSTAFEAGMA